MAKTACPYCCHPSSDPISPINPPQQGSADKIHQLHYKIRQLDETIAKLSRDRAELLKELNGVQSSTSILPREILSHIFQFVCSHPEFNSFPAKYDFSFPGVQVRTGKEKMEYGWYEMKLVLSRVSASWRRTVMTTPQLWTNVRLDIKTVATEDDVDFLRPFLKHSGQLPLTLSLCFSKNDVNEDTLFHPSLDALLVENLSRIKNLHLRSPPHAWFSLLPHLRQLTHFSFTNVHEYYPPLDLPLNRLSSLSELTLAGRPVTLSSPYLTVLNLHGVPLSGIFHIIANCPNLAKLYIEMPDYIYDEDNNFPLETFMLPHLEVFDFKVSNCMNMLNNWEEALLTRIHTPSLRAFSFIQPSFPRSIISPEHHGATAGFFARLPETLTHLEFIGIRDEQDVEGDVLLNLVNCNLRDDCQIESLEFVDCHLHFLTGILQNLVSPLRFPRLCRITVEKIFWPSSFHRPQELRQEEIAFLSRTFLDMVEKRLHESETSLALYMTQGGADAEWLDCIRSELTELKQRGRQLDIFVESKRVIP